MTPQREPSTKTSSKETSFGVGSRSEGDKKPIPGAVDFSGDVPDTIAKIPAAEFEAADPRDALERIQSGDAFFGAELARIKEAERLIEANRIGPAILAAHRSRNDYDGYRRNGINNVVFGFSEPDKHTSEAGSHFTTRRNEVFRPKRHGQSFDGKFTPEVMAKIREEWEFVGLELIEIRPVPNRIGEYESTKIMIRDGEPVGEDPSFRDWKISGEHKVYYDVKPPLLLDLITLGALDKPAEKVVDRELDLNEIEEAALRILAPSGDEEAPAASAGTNTPISTPSGVADSNE